VAVADERAVELRVHQVLSGVVRERRERRYIWQRSPPRKHVELCVSQEHQQRRGIRQCVLGDGDGV